MTWSAAEIERLMGKEPRLAVALMQVVVKRCLDFKNRLESFSVEGTAHRLARSLLHLADRMGGAAEDGAITIAPLTHELLAQYVGTSREIVSHHMSEFRSQGHVRYSRKGITIQRDSLEAWLRTRVKHA
jgi:CRP/FNR family transcriptional regulator